MQIGLKVGSEATLPGELSSPELRSDEMAILKLLCPFQESLGKIFQA